MKPRCAERDQEWLEAIELVNGLFGPQPITPADPNVKTTDAPRLTGQNATVLAWLLAGERVTPRTAFERGVLRLAARVKDIRAAGYHVRSDIDASRCAVYWMEATKC